MELTTDICCVKGIGQARAEKLKKLGITTLGELVSTFPRGYEDRREMRKINGVTPGENCCVTAMCATEPKLTHVRKGMDLVKVRVVDETGALGLTFFNQSYMKNALEVGKTYVFYGKVGGKLTAPEMINPIFEAEDRGEITGRIMPIYRLTAGISQNLLAKSVRQGLDACGDVLPDPLPPSVRLQYRLAQSRFAYENIHFPQSEEMLALARNRLVFEELFVLCCAMSVFRHGSEKKNGIRMTPPPAEEFYKYLPFSLTGAQKRAIRDVMQDLQSGRPMSRLVQGDVGSGKTMVAAAACWAVCSRGYQAAVMAPTEILAGQHYHTLSALFAKCGLRTELLTGGATAKQKREIKQRLAAGEIDVIIGTHALITQDVTYHSLGLVVADEQHRFGVQQRCALAEKGEMPHVLVMSATPIPRTLALIVYGDLDVSVIDELPPGRQTVETYAVGESMRLRIRNFIRKQVSEGRQVYIVCPMVEEQEEGNSELKPVKTYAKELQEIFADLSVGCLHGKMKPKEKEAVMADFSAGKTQILVSTTVIEVGVDVPNATLMIVENADRFGLSQLHQLRGRVGRGQHQSYCVLMEGSGSETAAKRLKAMCDTCDGFKIAETDLALRGPGDFFGNRQSGLPEMKIASFAENMDVLYAAKEAAEKIMADDPKLEKKENKSLAGFVEKMICRGAGTFN